MCELKKYKDCNVRIDKCMKVFIKNLNDLFENKNHKIVACCCGHNKYPMTIIIKNIFNGKCWDFVISQRLLIMKDKNPMIIDEVSSFDWNYIREKVRNKDFDDNSFRVNNALNKTHLVILNLLLNLNKRLDNLEYKFREIENDRK